MVKDYKLVKVKLISKNYVKFLIRNVKEPHFIPEIWQGHKDNGKGFWKALNHLEGIL